jgi:RNA polymerase sigma-70 factor (ECF subfamily)
MVLDANDREVIEACQRGDYDAFRVLFEALNDRVYSIALRYSGDETTAMDIAQESFLKLLASIRDFRGEATFESWLYRIVVNTCLDHQRRGRHQRPFIEELLDAVSAPVESALHRLLRAEVETDVQRIVAKLPAEQRIVVVLRYTEGLQYQQIAEILGCSAGTVGVAFESGAQGAGAAISAPAGARRWWCITKRGWSRCWCGSWGGCARRRSCGIGLKLLGTHRQECLCHTECLCYWRWLLLRWLQRLCGVCIRARWPFSRATRFGFEIG